MRRRTFDEIHSERHQFRGTKRWVPPIKTSSGVRFGYYTTLVDDDDFETELERYKKKYGIRSDSKNGRG